MTGGTFYDQFGSGLLFRSYEERMLGFNNALLGARATYSYKGMVNVKALWGTPRFGMTYDTGYAGAWRRSEPEHRGDMCGWNNTSLFVEGSVLNTFMEVSGPDGRAHESQPHGLFGPHQLRDGRLHCQTRNMWTTA